MNERKRCPDDGTLQSTGCSAELPDPPVSTQNNF